MIEGRVKTMGYNEQVIGIGIITICFLIALLYVAPIVIKDTIELIKEVKNEDTQTTEN